MNTINTLPFDVLQEIFNYTEVKDLHNLGQVCTTFDKVIKLRPYIYLGVVCKQWGIEIAAQEYKEICANFSQLQKQIVLHRILPLHYQTLEIPFTHPVPKEIRVILDKKSRTISEALLLSQYCQARDTLLVWKKLAAECKLEEPNVTCIEGCHTVEEIVKKASAFSSWRQEPKHLASIAKVKVLNLSNSKLTSLPQQLWDLKNLEELYLHFNRLPSLSPLLGNLTKLAYLNLAYNELQSLPGAIGNLTKLETLDLSKNRLKNLLPSIFVHFSQLRVLDLSYNKLMKIDPAITSLPSLKECDVSGNPSEKESD